MPYLIAVGGGSGSGKTTLARKLAQKLPQPVAILSYDSYYRDQSALTMEERCRINYDDPAVLDEPNFIKDIETLRANHAIEVPVYDFSTHTRKKETFHFEPTPIIIIEGIMIYSIPNPLSHFDYSVFVHAESDIRLCRRILRDEKERGRTPESVVGQYLATVRPMHKKYVEPDKKMVDFVFENSSQQGIDERELDRLIAIIKKRAGFPK